MQSFLIVSQNPLSVNDTVGKFKDKYQISDFDYLTFAENQPLGIGDVRNIEKEIYKKPFQGNYRLIILNRLDLASNEAQNALLKILEEQTKATIILATCNNDQKILPTVQSRCQIIRPGGISKESLKKDTVQSMEMFSALLKMYGPERLTMFPMSVKSREEASKFMDNLIDILEMNFFEDRLNLNKSQSANLLKKAQAAKRFLDLNINFKLVIDVFLLGLTD